MSIRIIHYNVSADALSPDIPCWGGMQYEDDASAVEFEPEAEFLAALEEQLGEGESLCYRIDFDSPGCGYQPSENLELTGNCVSRKIPLAVTQSGCNFQATLVIAKLDAEANTVAVVYSFPATLYLTGVQRTDAQLVNDLSAFEVKASMILDTAGTAAEGAAENAESAQSSAAAAEISATSAGTAVTAAQTAQAAADSSAESAGNSANAASVSATAAAGSALSAQTSAESAENSAGNAANSAEAALASQTAAEAAAESVLTSGVANALKGSKNGAIVSADDVSPIEHSLTVNLTSETITDFSTVSVSRYGKNLLNLSDINDASEYTTSGSAGYQSVAFQLCPNTTYTVAGNRTDGNVATPGYILAFNNVNYAAGNNAVHIFRGDYPGIPSGTITTDSTGKMYVCALWINQEKLDYMLANSNIQIEAGSTSTDYEAYIEPQTVQANADGTVTGLTSISPNMTLTQSTGGVNISLEYNRDINKAFEKLENLIAAL